jgi:hypothetical protein
MTLLKCFLELGTFYSRLAAFQVLAVRYTAQQLRVCKGNGWFILNFRKIRLGEGGCVSEVETLPFTGHHGSRTTIYFDNS